MVYSGPKPKFCSSCGVTIGGADSQAKAELPQQKSREILSLREQMESRKSGGSSLQDDETDIDYVPRLDGLEYSISHEGSGYNTHKFEDVINASTEEKPAQKKPEKRRGRPRKNRS